MNELFASIKAFIEKGNIIIFLLSIAAAIFTYQVLAKEILWAVFTFCVAYAVFYAIQSIFYNYQDKQKKQEEEKKRETAAKIQKQNEDAALKQQKEEQLARYRMIFNSFPEELKKGLLLLYNLPQVEGGYINSRIIKNDDSEESKIIQDTYWKIRLNAGLMDVLEIHKSIDSQIITMTPDFYSVIEEVAKKKKGE